MVSLITFYAFKKEEQVFLAKQVEIELQEKETTQKHTYTKESNEESLKMFAEKIQIEVGWKNKQIQSEAK